MECPKEVKFLKMKSDGVDSQDTIKTCVSQCPASVGYLDETEDSEHPKCYSNKRCPDTEDRKLYAYMHSTMDDAEIPCISQCPFEKGYKDETEPGNNKCFMDYRCSTDAPYTYAQSDFTGNDYKCAKVCNKFNGTMDENKPNGTWCLTDFKCSRPGNFLRKRSDNKHASVLCISACNMYDGNTDELNCYYGIL